MVRGWNEASQALEQLEGSEAKHLATVQIGLGEAVDQAGLRRGERSDAGRGVKPLQGERPTGAVANEPLQTRAVRALDADGAVDGESTGPAPGAHVRRSGRVEEPAPREPPQDAKLHGVGQGLRVSSPEAGGLVKPDSPLDVAGDHAVEGQHVVVVVGVKRTPEALREGDGSDLRVAKCDRSTRARVSERGPEPPEEDAKHRTRYLGRLVQEGPKPVGNGEHPLPDREVRDHLVGEVDRQFCHAPGAAGGADAATLAGESQEPFMPAVRAAHPREAMGQDAAAQIASEVVLHPPGDAPAHGVGLLRLAAVAVLSGNMFTVAARVASFFHLTPGALGDGASEDIRALREGVDGMRAEMGAGFEQVDGRFDEVVGVLDTRFNRLESLVAANHREVREDLLSLQLGLSVLGRRMDRMESNLQTYMQAGFDRDFSRTLIRCLEHRERHLPPHDRIEFAAFSECLTDFRARAVQDARDALLTDRTTPVDDVSLAEALADLSEDNLAYRLPLLARAAEQRFAYDGLLGGRGGVNAIEWSVAAQAYLTMLESWPDHTLAVGPGDLEAILATGLELQEILRAITASPRDATRWGLLTQVMRAYEDHVGVLTAEADVLARRHQQAQLLRVDPASVLGRMTPATEGRPELDTPGNVADAVPQELSTAAVLALREPQLVYRTVSAEHVRRDRFRRSGIFRQRRHDRHTFTQTTVEVELRLGDDQVAATYTATGPSVLTRVEEMSGGETSGDVRGVRHVIPDVDAHFASELWPALADDPAAWGIGRPGDALLTGIERAIETELRRHEAAALGEVFTAVCQDGPVTAVAADPDRASAARIREALDGMTATRRLLGAYARLGLPGTVDQDFKLRQLLYSPDGLLDREALCRSVSAGESPLRVVWLEEEPRRRAKELSEVLGAALERGSTLSGTAPTVDPMIDQV